MSGGARPIHVLMVGAPVATAADALAETREDITVEHVASASSAYKHLTSSEPDCLVTTYTLPDTDGLDLLETVRETHRTLPVILVTDDGSEDLARQAIAADATDYRPTPTTPTEVEQLADRIQDAAERTHPSQRLQELTAASTDIHWMFTADWDELLFINDAYEAIWGRSTTTLHSDPRDFLKGIHPDDRDRIHSAMATLSGGDPIDIEARVNPGEDYGRWVWIQGEPIHDASGEVVRVTGFARDITKRVDRRQRLERAEARFRTLAEHFPNGGVHYFDEDLRYQFVSGSGFDPIDTTPEDLVGNTIYEVEPYTEAEIETLEPLMEATLDGNRETLEIPYEGHIYEVHSVPLRDEAGDVTAGFFITQDVTEQREHEQKLAARSAAIEASIDGIAILNADDAYAYVNQAHADIYGYDDPTAFEGNSWRMCYEDAEQQRLETEVMPTLYENGGWRGEATGVRKDGSTFPQELSLSVTDDERIICVVRDISDRKAREQRLQRQNDRLEEFTSVVTHDLRGPLAVAKGRVALAREECDSPHLDDVAESVERAVELLADLRALAREGEDVGETEQVGLESVVTESWGAVETETATLTVESTRSVQADRSRVRQVFENLFRNAVDHGGPAVTVQVGATDEGFYVADDGPGIPPEDRDQVFETGYSTSASGTGYGLNIVGEIVAAHGWEIAVSDSEMGGARFDITGL